MKKFINILTSTDFKSILMKLPIFFVLMSLSFVNPIFSMIAFYFTAFFAIVEFSYNSIIWLLLYIICHPYSRPEWVLLALIIFAILYIVRFVKDIKKGECSIKNWNSIALMTIGSVIILLLLLPITPGYDFLKSLAETMAIIILTILFINYDKLNIKMIMKISPIFIAGYCIIYNIVGTLGLCFYNYHSYANVNRFSLFLRDPNYTAGLVLLALIFICYLSKIKDLKNWLFYTLFIILGICLINTISKAGFIVYVSLIVLLLIDKVIAIIKNKTKANILSLIYLLLSVVAVGLLSFRATGVMIARMFNFTNVDPDNQLSELTTGRGELLLVYIRGVFDTPYEAIFGHGLSAPLLEFAPNDFRDTHCIALSLAYCHGLLISVLLVGMFVIAFFKNKKTIHWFNMCLSGLLLLMYMSLSVFIFSQIYVFIAIFALAVAGKSDVDDNKAEDIKQFVT